MPEFIMEGKELPEFRKLDSFTQGYIQALFFTECEPNTTADAGQVDDFIRLWDPETQSSLPGDVGFADLDADSLARIIKACQEFQAIYEADLDTVDGYAHGRRGETYCREHAGHDFWLTRNGHGAGFWDRYKSSDDQPDVKAAFDRLSDAAKAKGECWATYGDDGKVYQS
ncbi:hypothetical protein KEU06_09415 [Pseudaminobacter sp. 19-2017]|uniref:Uncharacterized protein n=1 Tax=Pseudaminobacter soli (ex Zhang et al. 2022) TaxID=2831468 RepID=A0A942DX45_9HYPH|nr:hypothetical protein [Pseudaminobacter soli]MBS3648823.1 hypothetical protein [Pseudaminobacter soli]